MKSNNYYGTFCLENTYFLLVFVNDVFIFAFVLNSVQK